MKLSIYIFWTLLVAAAWPAAAVTVTNTNTTVRSLFVMPSSPSEGRDPFYPNSTRPYEDVVIKHTVDVPSFTIRGFSEIAGHRYVIINNHTFGQGDEGDVITPAGRIHLRCLTVGIDSVMIESGGSQQLLKISAQ